MEPRPSSPEYFLAYGALSAIVIGLTTVCFIVLDGALANWRLRRSLKKPLKGDYHGEQNTEHTERSFRGNAGQAEN